MEGRDSDDGTTFKTTAPDHVMISGTLTSGALSLVAETFSIQQFESLNKSDLVKTIVEEYSITNGGAVVGDRLSDIKAAKENGLVAIGCNFDFAQEDEISQANIVIDDLDELKTIVCDSKGLS